MNLITPSSLDARDYIYAASGGNFPATLDLKPHVFEIEDQSTIASCAANSAVSACEHLRPGCYSRLFAYYNARRYAGRLGQEGVELRHIIAAMRSPGTVLETDWPYDIAKVDVAPPANYYDIQSPVKRFWVRKYEQLFSSHELPANREYLVKAALNAGLPVIFGAQIRNDIYRVSGPWQTHNMSLTSPNIGGHAMLIIGYDNNVGRWLVQNSWGRAYADGGFFGYSYDLFMQDAFEAWVISDFDGYAARPVSSVSKAWVYLNAGGDVFTVANSGVQVYAGNGNDVVRILAGVVAVKLDANLNTLELPNNRATYQIGYTPMVGLTIASDGVVVASLSSLNAPLAVLFPDGSITIEQKSISQFDIT